MCRYFAIQQYHNIILPYMIITYYPCSQFHFQHSLGMNASSSVTCLLLAKFILMTIIISETDLEVKIITHLSGVRSFSFLPFFPFFPLFFPLFFFFFFFPLFLPLFLPFFPFLPLPLSLSTACSIIEEMFI